VIFIKRWSVQIFSLVRDGGRHEASHLSLHASTAFIMAVSIVKERGEVLSSKLHFFQTHTSKNIFFVILKKIIFAASRRHEETRQPCSKPPLNGSLKYLSRSIDTPFTREKKRIRFSKKLIGQQTSVWNGLILAKQMVQSLLYVDGLAAECHY
jgi:hypothetical protein